MRGGHPNVWQNWSDCVGFHSVLELLHIEAPDTVYWPDRFKEREKYLLKSEVEEVSTFISTILPSLHEKRLDKIQYVERSP